MIERVLNSIAIGGTAKEVAQRVVDDTPLTDLTSPKLDEAVTAFKDAGWDAHRLDYSVGRQN